MIEYMTARTNIKTGRTSYRVMYNSGKHIRERVLGPNDNWSMSMVKFFTAEDTIRVADKIIGEGDNAVRYERFEKA